jgi:hypothetical protein
MNQIDPQATGTVTSRWTRGLAQVGLGVFSFFIIVYMISAYRVPASQFIFPGLQALILGLPLLLLVLATWRRQKMTRGTWWLHLITMLIISCGLCVILLICVGGGHQVELVAAWFMVCHVVAAYPMALIAIILGLVIDSLLTHRNEQNIEV